jgi:hypothetical protein
MHETPRRNRGDGRATGQPQGLESETYFSVRRKVRDPRTPGRMARSAVTAGGSRIMRARASKSWSREFGRQKPRCDRPLNRCLLHLSSGQREHNRDLACDQAESSGCPPAWTPEKTTVHETPSRLIPWHPLAPHLGMYLAKNSPEPFARCGRQGTERITDPLDHHLLQGTRRASL